MAERKQYLLPDSKGSDKRSWHLGDGSFIPGKVSSFNV